MRSKVSVAAGILVAALVAGCGNRPDPGELLAGLPPERVSTEVFRGDSLSLIEYARNTLQAECMARKGYPQLEQAGVEQNPKPFADLDVAAPEFATATEEHARRLGFGRDEPGQKAHVVSYDAGFDRAFLGCRAEAGREIGGNAAQVESQVIDLYNTVSGERVRALESPAERAVTDRAVGALLDCVDKQGFRQLKPGARTLEAYGIGRPWGRHDGGEPPAPVRRPGTVVIVPPQPERRYRPIPQESRLAVATVRCARETRYAEAIGEQWTRLLFGALGKHETEIIELRPEVDKVAKSAAKVVGR